MVPKIVNRYTYKELNRIDGEIRLYDTPSGKLPSVTTILSSTETQEEKDGLQQWRDFVGHKTADLITKEASTIGSFMHGNLENRLLGKPDISGTMPIRVQARKMADLMQQNLWPNISEVTGMEVPLYHPGLYAGTTDLIGVHDGELSIIDYKNSRKLKKKEYISNYFMQGAAYALAHNELYGTNIKKIVIAVVARTEPLQYQEFIITDEFDKYADMWISRLEQYYKD